MASRTAEVQISTGEDASRVQELELAVSKRARVEGLSAPLQQQRRPGIGRGGVGVHVLTSTLIAQAVNKTIEEIHTPTSLHNRVAYQGAPGAYSETAARKACPEAEPLPCEQFEVAFQALTQWLADTAVLPIENSVGGSIHTVFDLLIKYRLHIVGEVSVDVRHCLMALPGVRKGDLRRVQSHPQALSQCDAYLSAMSGVVREAVSDTAGAAQAIAQNNQRDVAAIASERAAELYGMDILDRNIQDARDNITRFIVLSRDPLIALPDDPRTYKTSIVFSLPSSGPGEVPGPGQLFKAMSVFALRDVDLTKIESRPMRRGVAAAVGPDLIAASKGRFDYLFYVDIVGGLGDQIIQNALRHLQEIAPFLRVLGCYPMDLNAGDVSAAPADLPVDDRTLSGTALGMRSDDLLMAVSGASARMPMQSKAAQRGAPVVAFQGVYGAYSEAAALDAIPSCQPLPCEHFETAFQVLTQWLADSAILPIESSAHGSIHAVYDLLIRYRLHIVSERVTEIKHCLLVMPGTRREDIRRVISDPQALTHCDAFIRGLAGVVREAVGDTAAAAKTISENGWRDAAAIGSERAAQLYGLQVLEHDLQGDHPNHCRFLVLSRDPLVTAQSSGQRFKTSVVFSVMEGPGQLFKALSVFALRDLDMTKIESRPMRSNPVQLANGAVGGRRFRYLFYVDFVGNLADDLPQNALRHLQEVTDFMRVLGCYPMHVEAAQP
ncbi:g6129 [Coccomyxa elongata]